MQQNEYRFNRKEIRIYTGWSNTQLKIHLDRLVDMEYILAHRGKRGLSYQYELLYRDEGKREKTFVMGLLNPTCL